MKLTITTLALLVAVSSASVSTSCGNLASYIRDTKNSKSSISNTLTVVKDVGAVNQACLDAIQTALRTRFSTESEVVRRLEELTTVIKSAASNRAILPSFKYLKESTVSTFLKHSKNGDHFCASLTQQQVEELANNDSITAAVTPACFNLIPKTIALTSRGIERFKENVLSQFEGPIPDTWYKMTKSQLESYMSHSDLKAFRCQANFDPKKLTPERFSDIPADCFRNWLQNNSSGLEEKYVGRITLGMLSKCGVDAIQNGFEKAVNDHWHKLSVDVVDFLTSNPDYSMVVGHKAIKENTKVNRESFYYMKKTTQLKVMEIVKSLPDDLFADLVPSTVSKWDNAGVVKGSKNHCTGIKCFDLVKNRPNAAALMAGIKTYHCMDMEFSDLKEAWTFGKYMSRACFKELDRLPDKISDFSDVHEHVLQFVKPSDVKRDWKEEWEDYAKEYVKKSDKTGWTSGWRGVLRNPKFCRQQVTEKIVEKIRKTPGLMPAFSAFSSQCCQALPFFTKFTAADLKAIGPHVYTRFTKADKAKIDFSKSSSEQIARISSEVTNLADHYAAQVQAADLAKLPSEVFPLLHESWFRAFPDGTYEGFTAAQFSVVPADRLVNVPIGKIEKLPSAAANAMTPEQVTAIGSATNNEKEIVKLLKKFSFTSEATRKAFKIRKDAVDAGAITIAGAGLLSLAASIALLTPLL